MKYKYLFLGLLFLGIIFACLPVGRATFVSAQVCPVCVVAIGAGLGFSRWFGIDDVVSSVWIGAFMIAIISWTLDYMKKKKWSFTDDGIVITLAYVLLTYIPLYYAGIVGHPLNQIWGLDKIIVGSVMGFIVLYLGHWFNLYLKKQNNGKVFFPYQRVVVPVIFLLVTSFILYKVI